VVAAGVAPNAATAAVISPKAAAPMPDLPSNATEFPFQWVCELLR
jgi:hypothetical protein